MTLKFSAGLVILFFALALQFWFASAGVSLDLSFAALISFAFVFGIWELLVLVLLAVFIVNWQPAVSLEILIFSFYPVAVYFSRNLSQWQPWVKNLMAIALGFFVLYLAAGSVTFHWREFFMDLTAGLALGLLIFFPLYRWEKG
jgi:hypothetical protein